MRGALAGLLMPYPAGSFLPAVYQEDDFVMRWTAALDEVLAPRSVRCRFRPRSPHRMSG
ncbi:hypothetical protein ACFY2R_05770 [Micromonospora olivasterospora]|uniref:Uncharacterized protein n=1 Tax=Micromonospora olivasterospora TaxID=1880 RepID=A0A562II63_MICOL|nr:hypothetical protein [Micromonospora olivasterospora]TWH70506.1 hypothetical protein JD77_05531 [Micromonospora olivasterospora]